MINQLLGQAEPVIGRMCEAELRSKGGNPAESTNPQRWRAFVTSAGRFLIGQMLHTYGKTLTDIREVNALFDLPTVDEPRGGGEGQLPAA